MADSTPMPSLCAHPRRTQKYFEGTPPMSSRKDAARHTSDFVQLLQEFLAASSALRDLLENSAGRELQFESVAAVVGEDEGSVLYRLKQQSHSLFRSEVLASAAVRREALFDLTIGSLFHEAMKLRESLYQREVYGPRLASLRAATEDDSDASLGEFERLLGRSSARIDEVIAEVRILLSQTRDQFRRVLIERAGERGVTRALLGRRAQVDAVFQEGFEGLLSAMHGEVGTGLVEAAHALLDSAYFVEASKTLREAGRSANAPRAEITQLEHYAEGMQAFLEGDYASSLVALEAWVDLGGPIGEQDLARRAAAAIGRVGRLLESDAEGNAIMDSAKQLQLRLDAGSV
jgi:hypothetical protein